MPSTYILTDSHNLFHRQVNMTSRSSSIDEMIGFALHLLLTSMNKEYQVWNGTHCVVFLEGRSWRKSVYAPYKANRLQAHSQKTEEEKENHRVLLEAFDDFTEYLTEKTNVTVLKNPNAEADDMISIWVESHPNDQHVLISSDSDFIQLLRYPNFTLYDPVKDILIKREGVFNDKGKRLAFTVTSGAKIKIGEVDESFVPAPDWYEYALFLKCIRGDSSDNIFSAYPGVREKGTKKTVGIREAYEDRALKGYAWTNFMMTEWVDHNGEKQVVKDNYERNLGLIDLKKIPDDIKQSCLASIAAALDKPPVSAVDIGHQFMRFCGKWDLQKISNKSKDYMDMLRSRYVGQHE